MKKILLKYIPVLSDKNEQELAIQFYIQLVSMVLLLFAFIFSNQLLLPIILGIMLLIISPISIVSFVRAKKYPKFSWFFKNKTLIEKLATLSVMVILSVILILCVLTNLANESIISYSFLNKFIPIYMFVFFLIGILVLVIFIISIF